MARRLEILVQLRHQRRAAFKRSLIAHNRVSHRFNDSSFPQTRFGLSRNVPGIFGRQQNEYLGVIKDMFAASLQYTAPGDEKGTSTVRIAAVKAATAFICDNDEDQAVLRQLQPLIGSILHVSVLSILLSHHGSETSPNRSVACFSFSD